MAMSDIHKKALDKTLKVIVEDLDVLDALVHLQSNGILKQADADCVRAEKEPRTQVIELVKRIKQRGETAYRSFRDYILNCDGSKHIARSLDENLSDVTLKFDEVGEIHIWKRLEKKFHVFGGQRESIHNYPDIPNEINIILLGKAQTGKSATGNTLLGEPGSFAESDSSTSATERIQVKTVNVGKFIIRVVDTPGLSDTKHALQNETLLIDLAEEMETLGDIHLFLWVCNSMTEEEDIMDLIETAFTPRVYNHFIVVLTNAYSKFAGQKRAALSERVKQEREKGGIFGNLLFQVKDKIIAVENDFEEDIMAEIHRQKLLCCLAQVLHDNKGSVYSKEMFADVKRRIHHRIERKEQIKMMEETLNLYFVTYFSNFSLTQLDKVLPFL